MAKKTYEETFKTLREELIRIIDAETEKLYKDREIIGLHYDSLTMCLSPYGREKQLEVFEHLSDVIEALNDIAQDLNKLDNGSDFVIWDVQEENYVHNWRVILSYAKKYQRQLVKLVTKLQAPLSM